MMYMCVLSLIERSSDWLQHNSLIGTSSMFNVIINDIIDEMTHYCMTSYHESHDVNDVMVEKPKMAEVLRANYKIVI